MSRWTVQRLDQCPNCAGLKVQACPGPDCYEGVADPNCLLCAGRGRLPCLDCEGTGGPVMAEVDGEDFGRVWLPGQDPPQAAPGAGVSASAPGWRTERWEECPTCDGTKSDLCDKCVGEGLIHGGAVECDRCGGVGLVDCPDCDATGGPVFVEVAPDGSVGRVAPAGAAS